jgi:response regulator RpfG family c-di-GMP phosphodiesterase
MNQKILFVDDDANLLEAIQRALRKQFSIDTAVGGREGLARISSDGPYAVIVADMQMPEMSGIEFLRNVQNQSPDAVRMMLTGNSDLQTAVDAVNDGRVFRYLTKPCPPPTLAPALEAGLEQFRLQRAERELLENTLGGAVKVLTEVLSMIDPATFSRSQKLKEYVHEFATAADVSNSWELELGALLSEIGRVTLPPEVLDKMRQGIALIGREIDLARQVPEFGARLLENIPRLEAVANIVRYQQRLFDGSGHPLTGPVGEDIPIGARIIKVFGDLLDFEAKSVSRSAAFAHMQERVGWYDLKVLGAASRQFDVALGAHPRASGEPKPVRIDELRVGHVLAQDLRTPEGLLIVAANTRLTSMLLTKLLNFSTMETIENTLLVYDT